MAKKPPKSKPALKDRQKESNSLLELMALADKNLTDKRRLDTPEIHDFLIEHKDDKELWKVLRTIERIMKIWEGGGWF